MNVLPWHETVCVSESGLSRAQGWAGRSLNVHVFAQQVISEFTALHMYSYKLIRKLHW